MIGVPFISVGTVSGKRLITGCTISNIKYLSATLQLQEKRHIHILYSNFHYIPLFRVFKKGIKIVSSSADLEMAEGQCGM